MFLFIIGILSYSGSDVIDNGPVMTPYNHAFLIVGGFLCWEEIRFVIFTVDHEVAPLHLHLCI